MLDPTHPHHLLADAGSGLGLSNVLADIYAELVSPAQRRHSAKVAAFTGFVRERLTARSP